MEDENHVPWPHTFFGLRRGAGAHEDGGVRVVCWGLLLAVGLSGGDPSPVTCAPPELEAALRGEAALERTPPRAVKLLGSPNTLRRVYGDLHDRHGDLQPDQLACLLSRDAVAELARPEAVASVVEAYRDSTDPAFSSMVLMGMFRVLSEDVLTPLIQSYLARACRTATPGPFEIRVAGDALASTGEAYREKYVESTLLLYGPGSSVNYKTETNDCIFLADRALAEAALGTLPEAKRKVYAERFGQFYR